MPCDSHQAILLLFFHIFHLKLSDTLKERSRKNKNTNYSQFPMFVHTITTNFLVFADVREETSHLTRQSFSFNRLFVFCLHALPSFQKTGSTPFTSKMPQKTSKNLLPFRQKTYDHFYHLPTPQGGCSYHHLPLEILQREIPQKYLPAEVFFP